MEQAPSNDNGLGWRLKGPDADGLVWLVDDRAGGMMTQLGEFDDVATELADWLEQKDFGERASR